MTELDKTKLSPIENRVMSEIKNGEIKMKPKSYYIGLAFLGVAVVILFGVGAAYFTSVASLWVRIQIANGPAYGAKQNLAALLGSFPWWSLILGTVFLVGMVYLIRKVGIFYKVHLFYLVSLIIALVLAVGFIFSYSPLPNAFGNNNSNSNSNCSEDSVDCDSGGNGYMRGRQMK